MSRRGKKKTAAGQATTVVVTTAKQGPKRKGRRARTRANAVARARRGTGLTLDGRRFLRAVFAPYDFDQSGCRGVPDEYRGPAFVVQMRNQSTVNLTAGNKTFIAVLPTPQVAFWQASGTSATAATQYGPSVYPDATPLAAACVSWRVIGMEVEVKHFGAFLNASGMITVAKAPVKIMHSGAKAILGAGNTEVPSVDGLSQGFSGSSSAPHVVFPITQGCYAVATHSGAWDFTPNMDWPDNIPPAPGAGGTQAVTDGVLLTSAIPTFPFLGLDDHMSSILITVDPGNSATNTAALTIETTMLIEIQPQLNQILAKLVAQAPEHDPAALELYERLAQSMPVAVRAAENASFWERIWQGARFLAGGASTLPGFIGAAGQGLSALMDNFAEQLYIA